MGTANSVLRISLILILFVPGCLDYDPGDPLIRESEEYLGSDSTNPLIWEPEEYQPVEFNSLRIIFVIDGSQSMAATDPTAGRVRATEQIVWEYASNPEAEFGLIRFDGHATGLTARDGPDTLFTRDRRTLIPALAELDQSEGNTNYESALEMAKEAIELRLQNETHHSLANASYHLVFLSDGLPFPMDHDTQFNTPDRILQLVGQIAWLREFYGAGSIKLHFAYLNRNTPDAIAQPVAALHRELAAKGGGDYLEFGSSREINFSSIDFR